MRHFKGKIVGECFLHDGKCLTEGFLFMGNENKKNRVATLADCVPVSANLAFAVIMGL